MTKMMLRRVRVIFVLVIMVIITLAGRLAYLQVLKHDYYWYRAEQNRFTKITLPATVSYTHLDVYKRQVPPCGDHLHPFRGNRGGEAGGSRCHQPGGP